MISISNEIILNGVISKFTVKGAFETKGSKG